MHSECVRVVYARACDVCAWVGVCNCVQIPFAYYHVLKLLLLVSLVRARARAHPRTAFDAPSSDQLSNRVISNTWNEMPHSM